MAKRWKYMGDVNLYHGGTFYDFSTWKDGYVKAVEVTDLDSACGFPGAVLIERKTINVERRDLVQLDRALAVIGAKLLANGDIDDNGRVIKKGTSQHRFVQTYACQSYGYCDEDTSQVVQLEKDAPMTFDGWKAEKRLRVNASLENYVRREFLR